MPHETGSSVALSRASVRYAIDGLSVQGSGVSVAGSAFVNNTVADNEGRFGAPAIYTAGVDGRTWIANNVISIFVLVVYLFVFGPAAQQDTSAYTSHQELLLGLGATEGMNLDGGGSTTFVQGGRVVSRVATPASHTKSPAGVR